MTDLVDQLAPVLQSGAPVLCVDTCTVLDIMRDITREKVTEHEARAVHSLVAAMDAGRLIVIVAEQVVLEFADHVDGVEQEAETGLTRLMAEARRMNTVAGLFGAGASRHLDHMAGHPARSRKIAEGWLARATIVSAGPQVLSDAWTRVQQGRSPSTKGKQSMKDCVIIETYLAAWTALRAAGFSGDIVFTSSNRKDYCEDQGGRVLKPDLSPSFSALTVRFEPNLAATRHTLRL